MTRKRCWCDMGLLAALVLWMIANHPAAEATEPDLTWSPKPFVFDARGNGIRYIDFEKGDDNNPGTKEQPWKHHPWDKNATGQAAACEGIHTYCFKKGVVYRGALVAKESGEPGNPIRLTVDPSWGTGQAGLYGSVKIERGWRQCTDAEAPEIPISGRSKTWYIDLDKGFVPRLLWEVRNGEATRIPIARAPNWTITNPDDPRADWWELTGRIIELKLTLDSTKGFEKGDRVIGAGKWADRDENRDNIAASRNLVTEVGSNYITIESRAWKKGEIRKGVTITNGRAKAKVTGMSGVWENTARFVDTKHLREQQRDAYVGATLWAEGSNMPMPIPRKVLLYRPEENAVRAWAGSLDSGPAAYCRYYLENLPQFLDEPGEWCYVEKGEHAGRLYLRLPGDRNPNEAVIELAREPILIDIRNKSHIEISGLCLRFSATVDPNWPSRPPLIRPYAAAVHLLGNCSHIKVTHCRIAHVGYGITAMPEKHGDVLDRIEVSDNDIYEVDGSGIFFNLRHHWLLKKKAVVRLVHVKILRNRLRNIGRRVIEPKARGRDAINIQQGEIIEVAGNVVDRAWGVGILVFGGQDFQKGLIPHPLIRTLIHHNKVTNTLLGLQDFGGIASWQLGPSYVYNNISGNPVGYKHVHWRRFQTGEWKLGPTRRKNWHRRSCYGIGIYLDGQYKGYVFNNIAWGTNNNVNDPIYNACAFNEAQGFMNVVFNNTFYRFGVGLHKGMLQHNRCYYLGNLMLDIGNYFIRQEPSDEFLEYRSLAYARNVFHGKPFRFGKIGRRDDDENFFDMLPDWRKGIDKRGVMVIDTGVRAEPSQVKDATAHDFRLRPDSVAIDTGAKVFVPWSLSAVVGEWGFYKNRSNPTLILGENINMNDEWVSRSMFHCIPRNNLVAHGIDASNFRHGPLENWVDGALELNGVDEYCELRDADLRKSYNWRDPTHGAKGTYPGSKRVTVDMADNNFLIEVVLKTKPDLTQGGIVCKCDRKGYVLEVAGNGAAKMSLYFGNAICSRTSTAAINDGKWRHIIAEVDRKKSKGINIYVDGKLSNGAWSGTMDNAASISNTADFVVGKTTAGAAGPTERYFAGQLDFLRVSRGTLKDAETTIEELHKWEFDGPSLKDFYGRPVQGKCRDAGAVEYTER
ncbi:MAG: LamG domain-containing protein [Planctomycetes bacterium]|nr:LamG domain-containing protein [Planctomycetota bacterium]